MIGFVNTTISYRFVTIAVHLMMIRVTRPIRVRVSVRVRVKDGLSHVSTYDHSHVSPSTPHTLSYPFIYDFLDVLSTGSSNS